MQQERIRFLLGLTGKSAHTYYGDVPEVKRQNDEVVREEMGTDEVDDGVVAGTA